MDDGTWAPDQGQAPSVSLPAPSAAPTRVGGPAGRRYVWTPPSGESEPRSRAKRLALISLYIDLKYGIDVEEGLRIASKILEDPCGSTPGALKKARSEARAIIEFLKAGEDDVSGMPLDDVQFFEVQLRVAALQISEATQRRARALRGGKGGRPADGVRSAGHAVRERAGI
jgi:hypothetical protein